jgi:hypothetical protein
MTRGVKLATLGASPFALAACVAADCRPDLTNIVDIQGLLEANRAPARRRAHAVAQALRGLGGPLAGSVAVVAVGEPEGAADSEASSEDRRVEVLVAPHGTFNRGP